MRVRKFILSCLPFCFFFFPDFIQKREEPFSNPALCINFLKSFRAVVLNLKPKYLYLIVQPFALLAFDIFRAKYFFT